MDLVFWGVFCTRRSGVDCDLLITFRTRELCSMCDRGCATIGDSSSHFCTLPNVLLAVADKVEASSIPVALLLRCE